MSQSPGGKGDIGVTSDDGIGSGLAPAFMDTVYVSNHFADRPVLNANTLA
jgi:hypothetical protein